MSKYEYGQPELDASQVFLCHNSRDKQVVKRVRELLLANSVSVWMDEFCLPPGARWVRKIGEALCDCKMAVVCIGPHSEGAWQKDEIDLLIQRSKEGKLVIPLILPTCLDRVPVRPPWLETLQHVDLRCDELDVDPFGHLLACVDGRAPQGLYRPSVLVMRNSGDERNNEACKAIVRACEGELYRVRTIDYCHDSLAESQIKQWLSTSQVAVVLLSSDAHQTHPLPAFQLGIASGFERLAAECGTPLLKWRSPHMELPAHAADIDKFRSTDIEVCMPQQLVKLVMDACKQTFERQKIQSARESTRGVHRSVVGYPVKEKRFMRQVAEQLKQRGINCDSQPNCELLITLLCDDPTLYDAVIVVFTGDDEWLTNATFHLRRLRQLDANLLPSLGAFLHKCVDESEADPIPIQLDRFIEYFGFTDLPRLAENIVALGGKPV